MFEEIRLHSMPIDVALSRLAVNQCGVERVIVISTFVHVWRRRMRRRGKEIGSERRTRRMSERMSVR